MSKARAGDFVIYNNRKYEILTKTTNPLNSHADILTMTELTYWIEDVETKETIAVNESELLKKARVSNE